MDKVVTRKSECFGCSACINICPQKAINFVKDKEGFDYPVIDNKKCVDCGLCKKVCPSLNKAKNKTDASTAHYYAAASKKEKVVLNSSSGGIFTALSDAVLKQQGVVFGAYMDEAFVVRHGCSEDINRHLFVGSKYVQSSLADIFSKVNMCLQHNKAVLFSGSPCQIAGLNSFLQQKNTDISKLYTCDFICHGASSPLVWQHYIELLKKRHGNITKYVFRGKKAGWHEWYPVIKSESEDLSDRYRRKDSYILMYQTLFLTRRSCFECPFTCYERVSDITLGDFWNIKNISPDMDDDKGTSEILVNTVKGMELFTAIKSEIKYVECTKENVWQPHLEYPNNLPKGRKQFYIDFEKNDMEYIVKKYGKGDMMTRVKNFATPILKKTGLYVLFGKMYRILIVRK